MGDWSGFGDVSMRAIQATVNAVLRGSRTISESELCREIYGVDDESHKHRIHSVMGNIRHRALPIWYPGEGRFDPIRLSSHVARESTVTRSTHCERSSWRETSGSGDRCTPKLSIPSTEHGSRHVLRP